MNLLQRILSKRFAEAKSETENTTKIEVMHTQSAPKGVSGTEKFAGVITEDYFRLLQGSRKAKEYDKMRRGDARVTMCLEAVKGPIRGSDWGFQPFDTSDDAKTKADFLNFIFKEDIGVKSKKDFVLLLNEFLSLVDFGFTLFERAHKTATHPKWGTYIGLSALGWRHPKTIEKWNTDEFGELTGVEQQAYGDITKTVTMDATFLNVISLKREGDNYEGISMLRPCYGAWSRKQTDLKLLAIGNERMAIPTPKVKVPSGKENSDEYNAMVAALEALTSHQMNYITYPEGWELDFLLANFDPEKLKASIQFENEEMTFAFLANFLLLGAGGNSGAYALSQDLSDFFTGAILYIAKLIAGEMDKIGKELIDLNFGPQEQYPSMKVNGIVDEIDAAFGNLLKALTDAKHITPDDGIEEDLRRRMKLLPMREEDKGKRDKTPATDVDPLTGLPKVPPVDDVEETEVEEEEEETETKPPKKKLTDFQVRRIHLAESKAKASINSAQESIRVVMRQHISKASKGLVSDIIKNYESLPEASKINATNDVACRGLRDYQNALKEQMALIAADSIEKARREVPKAKKVKLAEFEDLPKKVQRYLTMQSKVLASSTFNDLEKVVFLQFGDSMVSTDSPSIIEQDIMEAAIAFEEGAGLSAAGGNAGSRVVNESRNAFFFDEEVSNEIESFTFVNGDPVSEICSDLSGQTCSVDDFESHRLFPPLHMNCKSYIIPNLKGDKNNPEITGFNTSYEPSL